MKYFHRSSSTHAFGDDSPVLWSCPRGPEKLRQTVRPEPGILCQTLVTFLQGMEVKRLCPIYDVQSVSQVQRCLSCLGEHRNLWRSHPTIIGTKRPAEASPGTKEKCQKADSNYAFSLLSPGSKMICYHNKTKEHRRDGPGEKQYSTVKRRA